MAIEHEPGCDRRHTPRQRCNGPMVEARLAAVGPPAAPAQSNAALGGHASWARSRPPLPAATVRRAVILELVPTAALILGGLVALLVAILDQAGRTLSSPAVNSITLILGASFLLGGLGWTHVDRPVIGRSLMIWRLTVLFLGLPLMFVGALYDGDDINVVVVLAWLGYLMLLIVVAASPISAWLLWRAESAADRSAGRTD